MINQVASSLIIHSFIQQLALSTAVLVFYCLYEKVSLDFVAWHHSHFIISHRLCVRNLDSVSEWTGLCSYCDASRSWNLWADFHFMSDCSAGMSRAAWLRLCLWFVSLITGFFILLHAASEPLSPWSFLHMASPLSLSGSPSSWVI